MIMRAALCCPHFFAQKVLTNEAEYSKMQSVAIKRCRFKKSSADA